MRAEWAASRTFETSATSPTGIRRSSTGAQVHRYLSLRSTRYGCALSKDPRGITTKLPVQDNRKWTRRKSVSPALPQTGVFEDDVVDGALHDSPVGVLGQVDADGLAGVPHNPADVPVPEHWVGVDA